MVVELISVGTELLLGNIVNTNAAYLAEEISKLGFSSYFQDVAGDNRERLGTVVRQALERSDIIILGGGLGPTQDDLTKEVTAEVMGFSLVEDFHSKERIKEYLEKRGLTVTENNWKQALIPEGAKVLDNENGTAPGIIMEKDGKYAILLPGPPNELKPMFENQVKPFMQGLQPGIIYSKTVRISGIGESMVETRISDLVKSENPTLATYAKTGEVHLRVSAKAENEKEAKKLVKPLVKEIKARFGSFVYSTEDDMTLEHAVAELLIANNFTLSVAESCTGGLLSGRLVNTPGISEVYKGGCVTYNNKVKRNLLGVRKNTLKKYGAVSGETAKEMAKGVAGLLKTDVSISVTGIAGPDGGTEEKPVGLVYIAVSVCGKTKVKEYHFSGNRAKIRETAVAAALQFAREAILQHCSKILFE